MLNQPYEISPDFPYESKYVSVLGSKMHYIEAGQGDPIVFLHGIPTWSYLWRNVIPFLSSHARCIAVDFIGFGRSDKPNIPYRVFDHIQYLDGFLDALKLRRITFVVHAWGSVIGFDCAMRRVRDVKGLAFLESHIRPTESWDMLSLPMQELMGVLDMEDGGYDVVMNSNYFVNRVLPRGVLRRLTDKEMAYYREPFQKPNSCLPLWQYLQDVPLGDGPQDVVRLIRRYSEWLRHSSLPKLMMYAVPGFVTTISTVKWAKDNLPNLNLVDIGDALHYVQESNPDLIGQEIARWYQEKVISPRMLAELEA